MNQNRKERRRYTTQRCLYSSTARVLSVLLVLIDPFVSCFQGSTNLPHAQSPNSRWGRRDVLPILPTVAALGKSAKSTHRYFPTSLMREKCAKDVGVCRLLSMPNNEAGDGDKSKRDLIGSFFQVWDTPEALAFSTLMGLSGAILGPFLDSYHSIFGVLDYNTPLALQLWGSPNNPALVTTYWVPTLFGLAGLLIGWLYIWLDYFFSEDVKNTSTVGENRSKNIDRRLEPSVPKILIGISFFTFQYWLSGVLSANGVDRTIIMGVMSILSTGGFLALDGTKSGVITSLATAFGGPLIEVGLISFLPHWGDGSAAYHYTDGGETGFFPLWIVPVYFLGGPANGNLARGFWNALQEQTADTIESGRDASDASIESGNSVPPCPYCLDSRAVPCPNCDDGTYTTYGRKVVCKCCRGKGLVICRDCFSKYGDDPNDIENIRRIMDQMPD